MPQKKLDFSPGQFLQVIFDQADSNNKELNKYLSFSSSPLHSYIEVTKRLSGSAFSQKMRDLKTGDEVSIKAPLGSCVFKESYKKIGFLIGGIGITPVISIIEYIMDSRLDTDVCVIYSNRTDEEIAFKKELDYWQAHNKNIKLSYIVTECQPKDPTCIFGKVDTALVKEKMCDIHEKTMFIFGPPKMVDAMNTLCVQLGCDMANVKRENFIGY
jgi:ferredoxin-NADP reductase